MNRDQEFWLGKFSALNAANTAARGRAPHKPLMLLTVMDLIESGHLRDGWVKLDPNLAATFRDYWSVVLERQRNSPDIPMPFHALGGEKDQVWRRFTPDGAPSQAKATTRLCLLDPVLWDCLQDRGFRHRARVVLVSLYFTPAEQVELCARLDLPLPKTQELAFLKAESDAFKARRKKGRDGRFKSLVLNGYHFTCALTGYRLDTESGSIVQAAHIHQHAKSGNDDPTNGLALTPDAHWMFDAGLWTAVPKGDDLLIHIAIGRYTESSPSREYLARHHGRRLLFHEDAKLRPDPKHFNWHRNHHGF